MELWIQLVTALTALSAVLIGPVVTYYTTKRQLRADNLFQSRQKWMSELRDNITYLTESITDLSIAETTSRQGYETDDFKKAFAKSILYVSRVRIFLNPDDPTHKELLDVLDSVTAFIVAEPTQRNENHDFGYWLDKISRRSQVVLKDAWEQAKFDIP